jgi:RHS repeat-associated protein
LNPLQISLFDTSTTTQGYTGHEQLDGVGLVHMGARLYDPELGRFIQADDIVEPEATQGLNRYSYVLNNPLSATDPTGNFSLRQALGVVVGIVAAYFGAYYFAKDLLLKSFLVAVAGGFASAAISTGSLKAGLWGAVSAAAFWGIGTYFSAKVTVSFGGSEVVHRVSSGVTLAKIAAHAGAGGVLTMLQGGKFGHGFVAAGFTEALSPAVGQIGEGKNFGTILARTAASSAIGGTASKISGGSFANGAQTGAFQQLFNSVIHSKNDPTTRNSDTVNKNNNFAKVFNINRTDALWEMSGTINVCLNSNVSEQVKNMLFLELDSAWNVQYSQPLIGPAIKIRIAFVEAVANCNLTVQTKPFDIGTFGESAIGGGDMFLSKAYSPFVIAHEFGHNLGLFHQGNFGGSAMSYAENRSVTYTDAYRLIEGYKWTRNISRNLNAPPWK